MSDDIMAMLRKPFAAEDIQWMPSTMGDSRGKPWMMVLAYVDARALQERLDAVFGWDNWRTQYRCMEIGRQTKTGTGDGGHTSHETIQHGVICRLWAKHMDRWAYKEDGAPETDIEAFKGGISSAFKRVCASGYGIGRYLYNLDTTFADCQYEQPPGPKSKLKADGWNRAYWSKGRKNIWWKTPTLPQEFLPEGE